MFVLRKSLAGLLLVCNTCRPETAEHAVVRHATDTVLAARFTVGRLTSQRSWQACDLLDTVSLVARVRCGQSPRPGSKQFSDLAGAARALRPVASSDSTWFTLRAWALLELRGLADSPAAIDRAIALLERARRRDPTSPVVLNDLAVAYLEQGQRDQEIQPMLRALDVVERALERDSTLATALFNRALILERLYLIATARRAWSRYLLVERDARWRKEAEDHVGRLRRSADDDAWVEMSSSSAQTGDSLRPELVALVGRSPQNARDYSFTLLRDWGAAIGRHDDARAEASLGAARAIAGVLAALDVDRSVSLAIRAIDASARDAVRLQSLARGHVDLVEGRQLYARASYTDAIECLTRAEDGLRRSGSPAARWAAFYRAASEVNHGDYEAADDRLRRAIAEATPDEPALAGKAVWGLGVSQLRRGNYENAVRLYQSAREHVERAREPENEGAISYVLAEALTLAGQARAGRAEAYRGLRLLSPHRTSNYLNNHLTTVAGIARRDASGYAALTIMREVLDVAQRIGRPQVLAWANRAYARELMTVGRPVAARAALEQARHWVDSVPQGRGRDRVHADVELVWAQLARDEDPRGARNILSSVVDAYASLKANGHLAAALYETSIVAMATGDRAGARSSIERAIEAIERQTGSFETTEARATFTETVENVFDAMMDLELASGRPDSAFAYLERGRMVAWTAGRQRIGLSAESAGWPSLDDIRVLLPDSTAMMEYAVLRDRLVVWTVSRAGWRHHVVPTPRDSLSALVDRAIREMGEANGDSTAALARLFDLLVRPVAGDLLGTPRVAIVPDRELGRLPFVALRDRSDGRYLLEKYEEVRTLPSAAFLTAALAKPQQRKRGGTALVVGNPTIDTAFASRLPALPGASREAERVAGLYPNALLLTGDQARRASVVDRLATSSVFHFAGHAIANSEQPELSYLALASGGTGDGALRGQEIGRLRLSNLKLAVLSACSTLNPRPSHTGAIAGLAYSFLRAGTPATISTLWDVSDDVTADLLVEFHRRFAGGVSAAKALHLAQLQALRSTRSELRAPRAWGAFIYTGP